MKKAIDYFYEILEIPRASGSEGLIADYLEGFAKSHSLEFIRDGQNNVLIRKNGTGTPLVLQGHSDMVCEMNEGVPHDFSRDPIKTTADGDIIRACGTTLGADDGISMAVMLTLLSDPTVSLPLECLVTSQEEIGLLGMKAFDFSEIRGRMMINMDSMDEGIATVSCCGGVRTDIIIPAEAASGSFKGYTLKVRGLYGGHSGEDINKNRGNAVLILLSLLENINNLRISEISGGAKDNAIPRECTVSFISDDSQLSDKIRSEEEEIRRTLCDDDCGFSISLESADLNKVFSEKTTERIYNIISQLSFGVIEMNPDIEGLVKTSANLGVISSDEESVKITVSSRSSDESVLDAIENKINSVSSSNNSSCSHSGRYPGWDFEKNSPLRELYLDTYRKLFNNEASYEGIHAGLECGIVKAALPDMDIISIGADITSPHTPDETLNTASLERLYSTVREMIRRIEED